MQNNQLSIEIGKSYPASKILQEMQKRQDLDISFGHILIEYETEKKHKYFIDEDYIKNLKNIPIKVYTIITIPNCHNFAHKLLEQQDIKEILEHIKKDNNLICVIDENDLKKANCDHKDMKKAISLINKVLKFNKMSFRASAHNEWIKLSYRKIKE